MRTIGIIGAPSSAGAYAPGQERAPAALRDAGLLRDLADRGAEVHDRGDTTPFRWSPDRASPRAQNVAAAAGTIAAVAESVAAALDAGEVALVLGGDCTVGLGAVRALAATPGYGLLYLDMHSDMNTPESTTDGALDWMGVAHLLGLEDTVPELVPAEPCSQPAAAVAARLRGVAGDDLGTRAAGRVCRSPPRRPRRWSPTRPGGGAGAGRAAARLRADRRPLRRRRRSTSPTRRCRRTRVATSASPSRRRWRHSRPWSPTRAWRR